MKNIILLGHNGFIGKQIYEYYYLNNIKINGFSSSEINLLNYESCKKLIPLIKKSSVIIMCSGIKSDHGNNFENHNHNIMMAYNLSKILCKCNFKKMVFLSSIAVYGVDTQDVNITEESKICTDTYYGLSKYSSENIFLLNDSLRRNMYQFVRIPSVYGLGDKINPQTPSGFFNKIKNSEVIELWGDGSEKREFIYIDDLAKILDNLSNSSFHGVINIGSGIGYSYIESIKFIEEVLNIQANVVNKKRTKSKIDKIFNPSLLSKLLPKLKLTSLKNGLEMMSSNQK